MPPQGARDGGPAVASVSEEWLALELRGGANPDQANAVMLGL